jgi:hypothetical protein
MLVLALGCAVQLEAADSAANRVLQLVDDSALRCPQTDGRTDNATVEAGSNLRLNWWSRLFDFGSGIRSAWGDGITKTLCNST